MDRCFTTMKLLEINPCGKVLVRGYVSSDESRFNLLSLVKVVVLLACVNVFKPSVEVCC